MARATNVSNSKTNDIPLTLTQADMLREIEHRDEHEIDCQLDEIGEALNGLQQIAQLQGAEVRLQNQTLDQVQEKTNKNRSKLSKVLSRFRS
mmetsp:Transcript_11768/g.28228  ORF Transcript_11768/g.28228 Transcript_11768/m.28228 type:complete len:92 (-) Transcript_11768:220-495(-)|eukprot:CAMPEP_0113609838 /NCGR_PEP_ID=MMETSP0017_2-20120614/4705_1 /TAXON_ID=2856 /ORGANISM="Cylindrotheca closterium" /LENGTH=91 /DNA_ID=CAMNT_0000518683 /DNA_START=16 /DNA_END=291 /DNA_ORIENTATION=+ /assembly_acc=CAM_ASM_000147